MSKSQYAKLVEISKRNALLNSIGLLLEWDQETYLPQGAISERSSQIEEMTALIHKQKTSKSFAKALSALINLDSGRILDPTLTPEQQSALREWRREYLRSVKLPGSFVKKFANLTALGTHKWASAKEQNNFAEFLPTLKKIVEMSRKKCDLLGYKDHPYDALLDLYEPEMTTAILTPLFEKLKVGLTLLLKRITAKEQVKCDFLQATFAPHTQLEFGRVLLKAMGFDPKTSRLDQSSHPFCTGINAKDTRMTTRIHPSFLLSNIFSVVHEGGHGLYNMGLPEEHFGMPLGEQVSLGIDESQSRWWETRIGRSYPFWQYFLPILQNFFPDELKKVTLEEFYKAVNCVRPSFIRVEADEVTYSLHIIVRYELEKGMIEGSIKPAEIPEAWNAKMKEYLGIVPPSDKEGCLQDIHWGMGGIGYFPTYTLGNLYAAQFFAAFEKEHANWKTKVAGGDLAFIREWLRTNIHQFGKQYSPNELVKRISGGPISEKPFLEYLEGKFKVIYNL